MKKKRIKKKIALVTGVTGQDGSYLAELLLKKGYIVHGLERRLSRLSSKRIDHIYQSPQVEKKNFTMHYGDLTDESSIFNLIDKIRPDEIYNLAAQSHVKVSFEIPVYTAEVDAIGTLRILEAVRILSLEKKTKFYQASSSELYGDTNIAPQNEKTPFNPSSPYAIAKLYAYWICKNYRKAYGIFACNGILFNHESERRGETFVTRKITRGISRIAYGLEKCLFLGNLSAKRDWGHAKDYVEMQWLMLQAKNPDDYVISTGKQYTVKNFVESSCKEIGISLKWVGKGIKEVGIISDLKKFNFPGLKIGKKIIKVDPSYFRPTEVNNLIGDSSKARRKLGWKSKTKFQELVYLMMTHDLRIAKDDFLKTKKQV
jgi:GDPmannose 4,6-dehydratase